MKLHSERTHRLLSYVLVIMFCGGVAVQAATTPATEGTHNCHGTRVVGSKPVCDPPAAAPTYETAAPATTPAPAPETPAAAIAAPRTAATNGRTCFDAADWAPAPDSRRPCIRVGRLFEDGSASLYQEDAGGHYRVRCTLQNPREVRVRGSYVTSCTRVR